MKEQIGTVTPMVWRELLKLSHVLDLNKGGYLDGRSGAINIWAGPEYKPDSWPAELEIRKGALDYPREFVCSVYPEWGDGDLDWSDRTTEYPLIADITIYAVVDWISESHGSKLAPGWWRWQQHELNDENCTCPNDAHHERYARVWRMRHGRVDGDLDWIKAQWQSYQHSATASVPPPLELEHVPDPLAGNCTRGHPLHRIVRVISSPYENGVGNWTHYCPECKALCADAYTRSAMMAEMMLRRGNDPDAPIGFVTGWSPN